MNQPKAVPLLPYLLALLSPLLLWLAFPGGGEIWPVVFFALIPFLSAIVVTRSNRQAAFVGLVCGIFHYLLLMYWIVLVLHQYGGLPWLVAFLALLLLAIYMAAYFALFAVAVRSALGSVDCKVAGLFALPALWVGLDWVRSWLFSGFPWMDLGYSLFAHPVLIQIADLLGHYGITYIVVLINLGILMIVNKRLNSSRSDKKITIFSIIIIIGLTLGYSQFRLQAVAEQVEAAPHARIGVVQGNIDQSIKWSPSMQRATVKRYLELTDRIAGAEQPELIVWPETALSFYPRNNPLMQLVEENRRAMGVSLLTGAPMYKIIDYEKKEVQYYNSAILISENDGDYLHNRYNKSHLVPFGEYVPLQQFLTFIAPLVESAGNFTPGAVEQPLLSGKTKLGVLICFESVFSDLTRKWVESGANVLVNLTNDAWYGKSSAPHHSLAMTVLRAVETRRSLVRSANTGISAFVEPTGKIDVQSELFVPWAAVARVALMEGTTFWVSWGCFFPPLCLGIGLLVFVWAVHRFRKGNLVAEKD
jgi:apolipoprotein N-acyltransferase